MTTAYYFHADCMRHEMGPSHPESPARIQAIDRHLEATGLRQQLRVLEPSVVDRQALLGPHPLEYVERIARLAPDSGRVVLDPDTSMNPYSHRASLLAAGAVRDATRRVLGGEVDNAFCAVRPPGHHAEANAAMGFCIYNNVAVGVATALAEPGIERVAVIDFDVHHGNGTVDIFKDDPRVMVCSSFQHPFYPMRHFDTDRPHVINTPLDAGTRGDRFRQIVEDAWLARLQAHAPQVVFVSAGFDAHRDDPLGGLNLSDADYRWVTELIVDVARLSAHGRIISVLEGGYDLAALARSAHEHIATLCAAA